MRHETQHNRSKEMQYRRAKAKGGTYFFTVVTYDRRRILCAPDNVSLLRTVFKRVMERHPFKIDAFVLLPDHLHSIFNRYVREGTYDVEWGVREAITFDPGTWGE